MRRCRASCQHRALVFEYHAARHAQVLEEEAVTIGDPEMIAERRARGVRPIVFRDWLLGTAKTPPPES